MLRTLLIDNYDSYTYNLFHLIAELAGCPPRVVRNDEMTWAELQALGFDNIVISPGPGRPDRPADFGVCREAIEQSKIPVLGVCLGHQGIAHFEGADIVSSADVFHGQISDVFHGGSELFRDLPSPFRAVRYHSLEVSALPPRLVETARTHDGVVMALRHREKPQWGVQFHPESICTEHGRTLMRNFLELAAERSPTNPTDPTCPTGPTNPTGPSSPTNPAITTSPTSPTSPTNPTNPVLSAIMTDLQERNPLSHRRLRTSWTSEEIFVHFFGDAKDAFWLDSGAEAVGAARFSYLGARTDDSPLIRYSSVDGQVHMNLQPKEAGSHAAWGSRPDGDTSTSEGTIFEYLKRALRDRKRPALPELPFDFQGGFVGYFGYELKTDCGAETRHRSPYPDAMGFFATRWIVVDHLEGWVYVVQEEGRGVGAGVVSSDRGDRGERAGRGERGASFAGDADLWIDSVAARLSEPPPELSDAALLADPDDDARVTSDRSREAYLQDVHHCLDKILEGESYELCLTNHYSAGFRPDPLLFYRELRRTSPAPFSAYLRFGELAVACASPERFLRVDAAGHVESKPIKGTRPRGRTLEEDEALRTSLRESEKDRAENLMIVDLIRNDLGRVCEIGSVGVPHLMEIESFAHVHQMVSTVVGRLAPTKCVVDLLEAAFPGGSMTGAPKIRSMEILDALEERARGIYSGSLGFLSSTGGADLNIVIRTAVIDEFGTTVGAGGAIVAKSEPDAEYTEMRLKAEPLLKVLGQLRSQRDRTEQSERLVRPCRE